MSLKNEIRDLIEEWVTLNPPLYVDYSSNIVSADTVQDAFDSGDVYAHTASFLAEQVTDSPSLRYEREEELRQYLEGKLSTGTEDDDLVQEHLDEESVEIRELLRDLDVEAVESENLVNEVLSTYKGFFQIHKDVNVKSLDDVRAAFNLDSAQTDILHVPDNLYYEDIEDTTPVILVYSDAKTMSSLLDQGGVINNPSLFGIRSGGALDFETPPLPGAVTLKPGDFSVEVDEAQEQNYHSIDNICGLDPTGFKDKVDVN